MSIQPLSTSGAARSPSLVEQRAIRACSPDAYAEVALEPVVLETQVTHPETRAL